MRTDSLVVNGNDMGEIVGNFYGTPVREFNNLAAEMREVDDMQVRIRASLGIDSVPAELLPGEVIKSNIIRRETTAEVIGDKFYTAEIPAGEQIPIDMARCTQVGLLMTWRPNNQEFAVIHEEVADEVSA